MRTRYERLRSVRSPLWRKRRAQAKRRRTLRHRVTNEIGSNFGGAQTVKQIRPDNLAIERVVQRMVTAMRRDNHQQKAQAR